MSRFTMVGLLILLAFASAALAADGAVLINQSTVTNGLTGCPTGGNFPIIICQSGSYKLSGNLVAPAGQQAILFAANNVVLDLNGFGVTRTLGPPPGALVYVGGPGVTAVSIRNGVVATSVTATTSASAFAVGFTASSSLIVEDLHIVTAPAPIGNLLGLVFGANSIIRHNIISGNFGGGGVQEACPSLLEGNVNASFFSLTDGPTCIKVNNIGPF